MTKYTGPILKRYRGLGEEFALAADRAVAEKFKKAQRKLPPGMHGKKTSVRKLTQYGFQLLEKQKAKTFYLLNERQLKNYYKKAAKEAGSTSDRLVGVLETRLDNLIYRSGALDSHRAARQLISHAHVLVNGRGVRVASYAVKPGEVISFEKASSGLKSRLKENLARNLAPEYLKIDKEKLTVELLRVPIREEVELPLDEKLIIEFYSR